MPAIVSSQQTFAGDGVTPVGWEIVPSDTDFLPLTITISNAPGAIPSVVESAAKTLVTTTFPFLACFVHCFTVSPFNIMVWLGNAGSAPSRAVWWTGLS